MKAVCAIALASAALGFAGCASAPSHSVLSALGPAPGSQAQLSRDGFLQVYSAHERAPIDVNAEEFFWNNDFGRNDFLQQPAHTRYSILTPEGTLYKRVTNARGTFDSEPALVELPPGTYEVRAQAEDENARTFVVVCPVVIAPGATTQVHLDHSWQPSRTIERSQLVWLPNGQSAGWRAMTNASP